MSEDALRDKASREAAGMAAEEPALPPVSTAAAARVVYIERFVDPPNPYLPAEERDGWTWHIGNWARASAARRVAVSPAGGVVPFAELEAAERCVRAARPPREGTPTLRGLSARR